MTVKKLGRESVIVEICVKSEHTVMRNLVHTAVAVIVVVSLSTACQEPQSLSSARSIELFDAPIRKEAVDLGRSPYLADADDSHTATLSCYYFPDFMVKEQDLGGRGSEWLSILRAPEEVPECRSSHEPGESVIEYPEWEGYFMGVKGDLVFFDGSDTVNGGLPFAVYDSSTGQKIFEDSAYYEPASSSSHVEAVTTSAGYLLRYLRVSTTSCDLNSEGAACWNELKADHALRSDGMPICTGYEHIADLVGTDRVESVIAYAVEVSLTPRPSIRSVPGTIRCWPSH